MALSPLLVQFKVMAPRHWVRLCSYRRCPCRGTGLVKPIPFGNLCYSGLFALKMMPVVLPVGTWSFWDGCRGNQASVEDGGMVGLHSGRWLLLCCLQCLCATAQSCCSCPPCASPTLPSSQSAGVTECTSWLGPMAAALQCCSGWCCSELIAAVPFCCPRWEAQGRL